MSLVTGLINYNVEKTVIYIKKKKSVELSNLDYRKRVKCK